MDLHFTHYHFVRLHRTLRCTPTMEAGVVSSPLTVKELVEMGRMKDIERLRAVILRLHGCDSSHVGSVAVHETHEDTTLWEGEVEIFSLSGHPTATRAYAWSHETDAGGRRYVAVLGVDPIKTAVDAVRAHIVSEYQAKSGGSRD